MKNLTKKQKITYVVITIIILAIIGTIIGVVTHKAKKPELIECKETEQQIKEEEVTNELPKDYKGEVDIVEEEIEVKGKDGKVEKKVVRKAVPKGQGKGKVVGTTNTNKMNTTKPTNKPTQKPTQKPTKPNTTKPKEPVNNNPILTFKKSEVDRVYTNGETGKAFLVLKKGKEYDVLDSWERKEYWTDMRTNPETVIETTPDGGMIYKMERLWSKTYEQMWKDQDKWENSEKYGKVNSWGSETVHYYKVRQRVTPYKW